MIDLHCHLLPGLDDGPADIDQALALARALVDDGIKQVVATVHWTPGVFAATAAAIRLERDRLAEALQRQGVPLRIGCASEARLSPDLPDRVAQGDVLCVGQHKGFKVLLLELPDAVVPPGTERLVRQLLDVRVLPMIVHPERNKAVMSHVERLRPLVEMGCLVQVTAASLVGEFGARAEAAAHEMVALDWVDVVASDAHNLKGRAPRMAAARQWLVRHTGEDHARRLTEGLPGRIVEPVAEPAQAA